MIDYLGARAEMFALLEGVKPSITTLLGYSPLVVYQGVDEQTKPNTEQLWFRASMQTVDEGQTALAGNDLKRRYTSEGLLFVQIFIPRARPQDYAFGLSVGKLVKNAYRGKSSPDCVWFKNVRIQELPQEMAWNRVNVVAEYQYDEIG